jgi:NADH-quinone oxidoreductase subunit M
MAVAGSVLQQINHGISTGALFLIVGILYERRHTRMISEFGGVATPMPNFAAIYLIISLSSLGMPLLNGFIGEFAILRGVFEVNKTWAAWGVFGIVLGAAYLLWLYQRVMFGPVTNPANSSLPDLNLREFACLVPLVLAAFWIGIYPKPLFDYLNPPSEKVVRIVNPSYFTLERVGETAVIVPPPSTPSAEEPEESPATAKPAPAQAGVPAGGQ